MSEQSKTEVTPAADGKTRRQLNEIRQLGAGKGEPDHTVPDHLSKHYHQDGNAFRSAYRPEKIEFVDRGNRIHAYFPISTFTVRAITETAEARGWKELEVTGAKQFQQSVYIEAAARGIGVRGYEPTQKDAEILQRREDRKAAQDNPVVQAFLDAKTDKDRTVAAKKHPELKEAFAADAMAQKMAEGIDSKKAATNFVDRMRDNIAIALHTGRNMPNPELTTGKPAPETKQQQDRSR